jgi:hypothetical protein
MSTYFEARQVKPEDYLDYTLPYWKKKDCQAIKMR